MTEDCTRVHNIPDSNLSGGAQGQHNRIIVKDERGRSLIEIPVKVGVIGALLASLAALGAVAALVTKCTIIVERREE